MNSIKLADVDLPPRLSSRPLTLRQPDFDLQFDSEILFYDVFCRSGVVFMIGPVLDDFSIDYLLNFLRVDNVSLKYLNFEVQRSKKVTKIVIYGFSQSSRITICKLDVFPEVRKPIFNGNTVLYTLQKNNSLSWIEDWVTLHNKIHGIDNVIIYDNGSDLYGVDDIEKLLKRCGVGYSVLSVPYLYGPGAYSNGEASSAWDSDFLQYAMFEHVRYCYFDGDGVLLNSDIDEILVDSSVIPRFMKSNHPAFCFSGRWVYLSESDFSENSDAIRHNMHTLIDQSVKCPNKWVANIGKLSRNSFLGVHNIINQSGVVDIDSVYAHFSGISNNWKYKRNVFMSDSKVGIEKFYF